MKNREEILLPLEDGWLSLVVDIPPQKVVHNFLVICHGLTGDKTGPQQLLTHMGVYLSQQGLLCIRFDFRGSGDSSGSFTTTSFASMQEDLAKVLQWAREVYPVEEFALAGVSIGGILPALACVSYPQCKAVVLISSDLREDILFHVDMEKEWIEIRGGHHYLHSHFLLERAGLRPRSTLFASNLPVKLFFGELDTKVVQAAKELAMMGIQTECLHGVDHLIENHEQRLQLYRNIFAFLTQHFIHPLDRTRKGDSFGNGK